MSNLQIMHMDQGSADWFRARLGIPTASEFKTVMSKGRGGGMSLSRRTYMLKLLGEQITGQPTANFSNEHTERGHEMEDEVRRFYTMLRDTDVERIGFARLEEPWGTIGCSPDALVGADGMLEIKTKLPHLHLDIWLTGEVPSEHIAQLQGQMMICNRQWIDFVSYWPAMKPFVARIQRDEKFIEELRAELQVFCGELQAAKARYDKAEEG